MSVDEGEPEQLQVLRAIRDAVVAVDDGRAEQLATRLMATESLERVVVQAMDRVGYEHGTYRRFTGGLIRWLRRAARDDQTWALARIGVEWWPQLALGSARSERDDVTTESKIEQEEADRCLAVAAGRGHRRAAFKCGTLDSLLTAYGDGTPDDLVDASDLRSIEARIAAIYAADGDPNATLWFRRATTSPRWEEDDGGASWLAAVGNYARWAHGREEMELCEQLSARVIDDAVIKSAADRGAMAADAHKKYRDSYQVAISNESARWLAMEHLLTQHDLTPDTDVELLRLLSRNHFFRTEARELVAAVWTRQRGDIRQSALVESCAWEFLGWLVTSVVPDLLRAIRFDREADRIQTASAGIDFSINGMWQPKADEARWSELRNRYRGFREPPLDELETAEFEALNSYERHPLDRFLDSQLDPWQSKEWLALRKRLSASGIGPPGWLHRNRSLADIGLDAAESTYEIGLRISDFESSDRLLSGSDTWLAVWLATTTPEPDGWTRSLAWSGTWDRVSPMIAEYVTTATKFVDSQRYGVAIDSSLVAAFDRWRADVESGVRERIVGILHAATGSI